LFFLYNQQSVKSKYAIVSGLELDVYKAIVLNVLDEMGGKPSSDDEDEDVSTSAKKLVIPLFPGALRPLQLLHEQY